MTSVRSIRKGLADRLETISGLRAYDVWPTTINPPVALVRPISGTYAETVGGAATHQFEITVLLQLSAQVSAQEDLDAYLASDGSRSVRAAVECDQMLGGAADSVSVSGWRDYGVMHVGADEEGRGVDYLGCRFDVEVLA